MSPILVLTDFSEHAAHAEAAAISIAKKTGAKLHFLYGLWTGVDWVHLSPSKADHYPEIKSQIAKAEDNLMERAAKANQAGVESDFSIAYLDGHKSVLSATSHIPHGLLVMGSQGGNAYRHYSIGSNSAKALRSEKAPTLIVQRPFPPLENLKTIVFASGLEPDTHGSFQKLIEFANSVGAENLHLLEVTTPNNFKPTSKVRQEMEAFVAQHDCPSIWLHNENHFNVEAGILELAERLNADMLAIANHGRSDISGLFIESIPENLIKYADLPVLSIRV